MNRIFIEENNKFKNEGYSRINVKNTILDIGCGIKPRFEIKGGIYICCEPFAEYVEKLREEQKRVSNNKIMIILQKDWKEVLEFLPHKSIDTVLLIDVIEHLEKEEGKELLKRTEELAINQIVVFTPLGYIEQHVQEDGKDAWGMNGAEQQKHLSGWYPEDFDDTWEFIINEKFHTVNNISQALEKPVGAFWAIKNFNSTNIVESNIYNSVLKEAFILELNRIQEKVKELNNQIYQINHDKKQKKEYYIVRILKKIKYKVMLLFKEKKRSDFKS